uniref:zinc ribbon domain-containing protein n=1 Tax=Sphingomonas sp. TaxID=28214 RepID=UPI00344E2ACF
MKRNGICPECGSHEVHVTQVYSRQSGMELLPKISGVFNRVRFDVLICGSCGYYRLFVPEDYLVDVIEKLPKLGAA